MAVDPSFPAYVGAPEAIAAQSQPAGVLMSWLDQLLQRLVPPHTDCLLKVSVDLGARVYDRGAGKLSDALRLMDTAVSDLHYDVVQEPGRDSGAFRDAWHASPPRAPKIAYPA